MTACRANAIRGARALGKKRSGGMKQHTKKISPLPPPPPFPTQPLTLARTPLHAGGGEGAYAALCGSLTVVTPASRAFSTARWR